MKYLFSILFSTFIIIPIFGQVNLIQNGNFQTQNFAWSSTGNFFYGNPNLANCFSCPGYAYTAANFAGAGGNNYTGNLVQQVAIPSNTIHISFTFWYYITTQETTTQFPFDICNIEIWNSSMTSILWSGGSLSNLNSSGGYQFASFNNLPLSMAGQTVNVRFIVNTNSNLITTFRFDDISLVVDLGSQNCVTWVNGTPNDPELLTAAEYLCNNNIIPNQQPTNLLDQPMILTDECLYVTNSLFNQSSQLPSDYFPVLQTDVDLSFASPEIKRALRAMLFLEYDDGRPAVSREYFYLKSLHSLELGKGLRVIFEAWNIPGNWSGYDQYSENQSGFICNVKRDDPFYGYIQAAYNNGWLNGIIYNSNCSLPFIPQYLTWRSFYKILYRIMNSRPYPNPTQNSFYQPLNVSTVNANASQDLQNGAFSNYEESSFNISGSGLPLLFKHVYNSSLLEMPCLNHQIGPDMQILEYRQKETFTPLGDGWTHSFNIYMQSTTQVNGQDKDLIIRWGDGTAHVYDLLQHKYSTKGVYDNLIITSTSGNGNPNTVLIVKKDQTQYSFARSGQGEIFTLQSIKDRNNNTLLFTWVQGDPFFVNGINVSPLRIQKVTDLNTQRTINFNYQPGTNYLSSVADNSGRILFFNVDKFSHNLLNFTDAKGQTTSYIYGIGDTANHLLLKIKRPKGNFIDNTFQKRKIKSTQANQYKIDVNFSPNYFNTGISTQSTVTVTPQTGQSYTTNFQHDYLGNTVQEVSNTSSTTINYFDLNNPTLPSNITDNKLNIVNQYTYDSRGNTIFNSRSGPGLNAFQYFQYNNYNDITQTTDALNNITKYFYDTRGNLVSKVSPTGDVTLYSRNNFGNVTQVSEGGVTTNIGYNTYGNVDSLQISGTNISAKAYYDQVSRVITIRNPNGSQQGGKYAQIDPLIPA